MNFRNTVTILASVLLSLAFPTLLYAVSKTLPVATAIDTSSVSSAASVPFYEGKHVVIHTDTLKVDLMDGTSTLKEFPIITIGKPDSYYETLGGAYESDYKMPNHFSSIGHVYMPWSVHIFGNFFIHGIPYYPDGEEVSSAYSGGCVRLSNVDAKEVYKFVQKGTPIIVTQNTAEDFIPTATSTELMNSMDMTRFMAGVVSLEVLTQDNQIMGINGKPTTRRSLLPQVFSDEATIHTLAQERGEDTFLVYMNEKAKSLGLTNTRFSSIDGPATTSKEDFERFLAYVEDYKTYLYSIASAKQLAFQ